MFRKVLIANRGEIAVRIIRTLREMGIVSVAAYSDADRHALFTATADESYHLGPSPAALSYLDVDAVLAVARRAGVDAIHPGYGFLSENVQFAKAVEESGIAFIGPSLGALRTMGDKVAARAAVSELGVPLVPGSEGEVTGLGDARAVGRRIGYPLAVKASGGGGGRGIRVVWKEEELADALEAARREAQSYFKNPGLYVERYFPEPRHVEVQVLGDRRGTLVHLGERDCSLQRRHQKLIEESPSPAVNPNLRSRLGAAALSAARSVAYDSAGTVEFLLAPDGDFYFLEMNTRIQVEHPVTETVTGTDLIREMILSAAGERISLTDDVEYLRGHAIEVRINAEDPRNQFRPTPSAIESYREPGGPGTRVDSGVSAGYSIPPDYDSLIAKLICWAPTREEARARTLRALHEYSVVGPATTIGFADAALRHPVFAAGDVTTSFMDRFGDGIVENMRDTPSGSLVSASTESGDFRSFEVEVDRRLFRVRVKEEQSTTSHSGRNVNRSRSQKARPVESGPELISPMHGTVVGVHKQPGDQVQSGEAVVTLEAMKMENDIRAHKAGTVVRVMVQIGESVESGQGLLRIE